MANLPRSHPRPGAVQSFLHISPAKEEGVLATVEPKGERGRGGEGGGGATLVEHYNFSVESTDWDGPVGEETSGGRK